MGAPDTAGILQSIQSIGQGLQLNGVRAFKPENVTIGTIKDITNRTPCMEITADVDESKRYAMGGTIEDGQDFVFELTAGMADAEDSELLLAQLRDVATQKFHSLAKLNSTTGVQSSKLTGPGSRGYKFRNGEWYRSYTNKVHVRYEYVTVITP